MSTQGTSAWAPQLKEAKKHGNNDPSPYGRAMQHLAQTESLDKALEDKVRTLEDLINEAGLNADDVHIGTSLAELAAAFREAESKKKGSGRPALLAALKDAGVDRLGHRQALASALAKARNGDRLIPAQDYESAAKAKAADKAKVDAILAERAAKAAAAAAAEPAAPAPAAADGAALEPLMASTRVMMFGLLARPDLNGQHGVISGFNAERGRYNIDVKGETVALKPENVKAATPAASVSVQKVMAHSAVDLS